MMFRNLQFGSCYVYSPHGTCPLSARSRLARTFLKAGDSSFLRTFAGLVGRQVRIGCPLLPVFDGYPLLVPVPGAEPRDGSAAWVAERLCSALLQHGLGGGVCAVLRRTYAVRKSATAIAGDRPTVADHYESLVVDRAAIRPGRILLVDDVVTKGRTLLAAAERIHEAFPSTQVSAFAFVRTMGRVPRIDRLVEPCIGEIRWVRGDARRTP